MILLRKLILVTLASTLLTASTEDPDICSYSCVNCYRDKNGQNNCSICFRTTFEYEAQKCSAKPVKGQNCDLNVQQFICAQCSAGYVRNNDESACPTTTHVPNCLSGYYYYTTEHCEVCNHGFYPNKNLTACLPPSRVIGADKNCVWGSKDGGTGALICSRCKKGYMSYANGNQNHCIKSTIEGCLVAVAEEGSTCYLCDGWEGYYMEPVTQTCKRVPQL